MKKLFTNNKGKFSIWKTLRNILVVCILVGAAFAGKVYSDIEATLQSVNNEVSVDSLREDGVSITEGEPLNVLLIGTDGNEADRSAEDGYVSRSDTLMLVNLNPESKQTKVISIPRDVLANIDGVEGPDKINHAYAYGGADLTIDTVQDYLQIPIDYYAEIDMSGLEELIDAIGGIEVTSPLTFEYRGTQFEKGETREVNGVKALNFARMRYDDPQGEIGRQNRQKIVVQAIVDKIISLDGVSNYMSILQVISDNVVTNVDLSTALDLAQTYLPALENVSSVQFDTLEEIYIDGVFYFHIPLSSRVQVANEFRYQSDLPPLVASDFEDPLASQENLENAKNLAVVINQYPTGLSEDERQTIIDDQEELETIRQSEYTEPVENTQPSYSYPAEEPYVPPVESNPESNWAPPAESSPPQSIPQPEQPPVETQPPVEQAPPLESSTPANPGTLPSGNSSNSTEPASSY